MSFSTPEPISPVDPSPPCRVRDTPGTEFFSALHLDSPRGMGTKPLRVKKRVARTAGVRARRSTLSLPRTPRSSSGHSTPTRPQRTNTTSTNASRIHHSISQIFLASSPLDLSPPPLPPKHHAYSGVETIAPSPPVSPDTDSPRLPLTPSRAPPKAARLLGTHVKTQIKQKVPRKHHYRPLPTQTLIEIEKFLGNVPPAPPKSSLKPISRAIERKVGHGKTVRHRAMDGTMWMDEEEEQEFASLLGDKETFASVLTSVPPRTTSRPQLARADSAESDTSTGSRRRKAPPPPLKLKPRQINPSLLIISRTPEPSKKVNSHRPKIVDNPFRASQPVQIQSTPETPFVRPRRAPVPLSVYPEEYQIPSDPSPNSVTHSPLDTQISFFDPVTPTSPRPAHRRVLSGSSAAEAAVKSGAWLKKVVGVRRGQLVRV
ncbi:hypothetical protein BD324DRAFT_631014 [Kockovaella imperatae]|uniref:Uncharacterized protein n=1 Tax=Kockovaella imperatae TaxID=4999 RepID=A0A1Y1UCA8_9TREE|nr:hypothetical protein BD324DRAFT_631014 [Kockovaella imperatae]ORX35649.1 hypothetical protein BD324DRAFT_631014 [Kockovaella imperatae]